MNRYQLDVQHAIAHLGDHVAKVQLLMRNLAESRSLGEVELDPESELAVVCYLEEANDVLGRHDRQRRRERA